MIPLKNSGPPNNRSARDTQEAPFSNRSRTVRFSSMNNESHAGSGKDVRILKWSVVLILIALLAMAAVLGHVIIGMNDTISRQGDQMEAMQQTISSLQQEITGLRTALQRQTQTSSVVLSDIYRDISDSVVVVEGIVITYTYTFFGPIPQYVGVQGSGFIYNSSGKIVVVTNYHVIAQAFNLTVSFTDGDAYGATVLGSDAYSDLAVLSVSAPADEFKPLSVASSSSLQVGDSVIAVGNPFGLTGSMTTGIVSQLGRTIQESTTRGYSIANVIQISTPINPGNSGGPLLDSLGQVVGITTAIVSDSQGIGFAIPSDTLLKEVPDLIRLGSYSKHPTMGVNGTDITVSSAKTLKLNVTYGWMIVSISSGSPGEKASLMKGDVIVAIDGTRIRNMDDLSTYLETKTEPGQTILVTALRAGSKITVQLTLGSRAPLK